MKSIFILMLSVSCIIAQSNSRYVLQNELKHFVVSSGIVFPGGEFMEKGDTKTGYSLEVDYQTSLWKNIYYVFSGNYTVISEESKGTHQFNVTKLKVTDWKFLNALAGIGIHSNIEEPMLVYLSFQAGIVIPSGGIKNYGGYIEVPEADISMVMNIKAGMTFGQIVDVFAKYSINSPEYRIKVYNAVVSISSRDQNYFSLMVGIRF